MLAFTGLRLKIHIKLLILNNVKLFEYNFSGAKKRHKTDLQMGCSRWFGEIIIKIWCGAD